jgi:hypothetical protein
MRKWLKCYKQIEIVCSSFIVQHIVIYEVIRKSKFNNRTVVIGNTFSCKDEGIEYTLQFKADMIEADILYEAGYAY